ncbi:MAG: radical SAM protein [Bacteroidetes bacterium 4572_128]|nr:MAG: radical SAM protein [Bacteroidetes bacterium 4572_128]
MSFLLFEEIVFGPVLSRRLGVSLGINLLPTNYKLCNFNCIYCECGWTYKNKIKNFKFPSVEKVKIALEKKLSEMVNNNSKLDSITFAGNGEPSLHPDFEEIVDNVIKIKNKYFEKSKISVLSNASMLHKHSVVSALKKVDNNILKLDGAFEKTICKINKPFYNFNLKKLLKQFKSFEGNLIIQTLFLKGFHKNEEIDNTKDEEIEEWLNLLKIIKPKKVMIYTIARNTPEINLEKIDDEKIKEIYKKLQKCGFNF